MRRFRYSLREIATATEYAIFDGCGVCQDDVAGNSRRSM